MINDAYSLILGRVATNSERQYWNGRLNRLSPIAVLDLYDGLTRLPEYKKRFDGLSQKAQVALLYRTLLRKNTVDPGSEAIWLKYLQTHGLADTTESIVASGDRTMGVYQTVGLSTQKEADAVHTAELLVPKDRQKAADLYKAIAARTRVPAPFQYLARVQEGQYTKWAIETLQSGTARFPDDCNSEFRLGRLLHDLGVHGQSFKRSTNAMHVSDERIGADSIVIDMKQRLAQAKHPELLSRDMLLGRIEAHSRSDQWPAVFAEADRAIAFGPGDGTAYMYRGDAYFNTKKFEQAVKDLDTAEKYTGKPLVLLMARSQSLAELGQWQRAIDDFNLLIKAWPYSKFYLVRAKCYGAVGKKKEQLADLSVAITYEPRNAKPLIARGKVYLSMGKTKEALTDANKAVSLGKRYRESYKFRVECYEKMKNKAAADADRKTIEQLSKVFDNPEF